ncbi:hypothetical protein CcI49_11335 [Frankia sp. CcI49]|nr:hypothetical protein CcI49_11335 [Frankia sp. CcI49]
MISDDSTRLRTAGHRPRPEDLDIYRRRGQAVCIRRSANVERLGTKQHPGGAPASGLVSSIRAGRRSDRAKNDGGSEPILLSGSEDLKKLALPSIAS